MQLEEKESQGETERERQRETKKQEVVVAALGALGVASPPPSQIQVWGCSPRDFTPRETWPLIPQLHNYSCGALTDLQAYLIRKDRESERKYPELLPTPNLV